MVRWSGCGSGWMGPTVPYVIFPHVGILGIRSIGFTVMYADDSFSGLRCEVGWWYEPAMVGLEAQPTNANTTRGNESARCHDHNWAVRESRWQVGAD
jgi:hypothetical protein